MEFTQWIETLIGRHERSLVRYAWSLCGSEAMARDAVQETFLRLCRERPADLDGHETAWLFRVCRSRVADLRRKERPAVSLDPHDAARIPSPGPNPAEALGQDEARAIALRLVGTLPAQQAEVLRLKFEHDLAYREIAAITGLSEGNTGYLIHLGLKALRDQMKPLMGGRA